MYLKEFIHCLFDYVGKTIFTGKINESSTSVDISNLNFRCLFCKNIWRARSDYKKSDKKIIVHVVNLQCI